MERESSLSFIDMKAKFLLERSEDFDDCVFMLESIVLTL